MIKPECEIVCFPNMPGWFLLVKHPCVLLLYRDHPCYHSRRINLTDGRHASHAVIKPEQGRLEIVSFCTILYISGPLDFPASSLPIFGFTSIFPHPTGYLLVVFNPP